jgi:hypothetical protein
MLTALYWAKAQYCGRPSLADGTGTIQPLLLPGLAEHRVIAVLDSLGYSTDDSSSIRDPGAGLGYSEGPDERFLYAALRRKCATGLVVTSDGLFLVARFDSTRTLLDWPLTESFMGP